MTAYLDRVRGPAGGRQPLQVRPRSRFEPAPPGSEPPWQRAVTVAGPPPLQASNDQVEVDNHETPPGAGGAARETNLAGTSAVVMPVARNHGAAREALIEGPKEDQQDGQQTTRLPAQADDQPVAHSSAPAFGLDPDAPAPVEPHFQPDSEGSRPVAGMTRERSHRLKEAGSPAEIARPPARVDAVRRPPEPTDTAADRESMARPPSTAFVSSDRSPNRPTTEETRDRESNKGVLGHLSGPLSDRARAEVSMEPIDPSPLPRPVGAVDPYRRRLIPRADATDDENRTASGDHVSTGAGNTVASGRTSAGPTGRREADRRAADRDRPNEVTITIGRIEVRVGPPQVAAPVTPANGGTARSRPQPSRLDDYLRARTARRIG